MKKYFTAWFVLPFICGLANFMVSGYMVWLAFKIDILACYVFFPLFGMFTASLGYRVIKKAFAELKEKQKRLKKCFQFFKEKEIA